MQADFHYYATYCAAYLAGYSHEESMDICYSSQFVDLCSKTFLSGINADTKAATTMQKLEMMDARTDPVGLADITRIWASFHFLPYDLYATKAKRTKIYMNKYRLICGPDGELTGKTVMLAKDRSLQSVGIAMHVIADTWAHRYFAGTPSLVINNTNDDFYELIDTDDGQIRKDISFRHSPSAPDDPEKGLYTNSIYHGRESSVMNLGHGRAGHLPDYSFIRYVYLPAWNDYRAVIKDNPAEYRNAFGQMIAALKYLNGSAKSFETGVYDHSAFCGYEDEITGILKKRQLIASDDWKAFGEKLSGREICDFDTDMYREEYINAPESEKEDTFLGKFIKGAIAHKGMVCEEIYRSKNPLAGFVENGTGHDKISKG